MPDCDQGDYPTWCSIHERPAVRCHVETAIKKAAKDVIEVFRLRGHKTEDQVQIAHTVLRAAYPNETEARRVAEELAHESGQR